MIDVVNQRIDPGLRHVGIGPKIKSGIEQRVRHPALSGPRAKIMHDRIGAGLPHVPVGLTIKLLIEEARLLDSFNQQTLLHSEPDARYGAASGIQVLNEAAHFRLAR
ncbi:MAG: hypothetical protein ABSH40_15450 [Bryobacteraceae bacterium]